MKFLRILFNDMSEVFTLQNLYSLIMTIIMALVLGIILIYLGRGLAWCLSETITDANEILFAAIAGWLLITALCVGAYIYTIFRRIL